MRRINETYEEGKMRWAAQRRQNETEEKVNVRSENMRMQTEECFRQEIEEQRSRSRNENTGALKNARNTENRVHRVNNLITGVNYQQHNCGG